MSFGQLRLLARFRNISHVRFLGMGGGGTFLVMGGVRVLRAQSPILVVNEFSTIKTRTAFDN